MAVSWQGLQSDWLSLLQADALIGCFRFLQGYYLLFVIQKKYVGNICGKLQMPSRLCSASWMLCERCLANPCFPAGSHKIYSIGDIRIVSLQSAGVGRFAKYLYKQN